MVVATSGRNKAANVTGHWDDLFDDSGGYDVETGVKLAPGLTPEERMQARVLYNLFNELWGVCIVVGDPGSGKDLFGNYITWKLKRYFPHKRVLRDERPRSLYGPYAGLFNPDVLREDLQRMREVARGRSASEREEAMEKAADEWVSSRGEVLLKNSILYLTEYWRYCYNREPHNPMNKTMGGIHKMKRHLDVLVIGTVQLASELDKKTCLPWVDWRVTCVRSTVNTTGFTYFIERVKYDRRLDMLVPLSQPFSIAIDAGKPRSYLGDGRIRLVRPDYRPRNEDERVVLEVLKAGVDRYEDMVEILGSASGMEEYEVLQTLKHLNFGMRKLGGAVITYPCFFGLYNSKSAPQLTTSLKGE